MYLFKFVVIWSGDTNIPDTAPILQMIEQHATEQATKQRTLPGTNRALNQRQSQPYKSTTLTRPDVFSRGCLYQKVMPRHLGKSFLNIWWVLTAWWCFLVRSLFTNLLCNFQTAQMAGHLMALLATSSRRLASRAGTMHAPLAWQCRLTWWASVARKSRHSSSLRPENTTKTSFGLDSMTSESKGSSSGVTGHPQHTPTGIRVNQTTYITKIVLSSINTRSTSGMTCLAHTNSSSFASKQEVKRNLLIAMITSSFRELYPQRSNPAGNIYSGNLLL